MRSTVCSAFVSKEHAWARQDDLTFLDLLHALLHRSKISLGRLFRGFLCSLPLFLSGEIGGALFIVRLGFKVVGDGEPGDRHRGGLGIKRWSLTILSVTEVLTLVNGSIAARIEHSDERGAFGYAF